MSAWSHLPNAALIMRVLGDARAYPDEWLTAHAKAAQVRGPTDREVAWRAAWNHHDSLRPVDTTRVAPWHYAQEGRSLQERAPLGLGLLMDLGLLATADAVLALGVWDEAGDVLRLEVPAVKLLAGSGNPAATLLLPAAIAMAEHA